MLHEGARFISSAAETNKQRLSFRTSGQRVPGGLLVNGTKYFGTGSDGARYGVVPLLLDGYASVEAGGGVAAAGVVTRMRAQHAEYKTFGFIASLLFRSRGLTAH